KSCRVASKKSFASFDSLAAAKSTQTQASGSRGRSLRAAAVLPATEVPEPGLRASSIAARRASALFDTCTVAPARAAWPSLPRLAECVEPDHGFRELAGVLDGHHDAGRVRDVLQRVRAVGGGSRGGRGGEHGQDEQAGHAVAPRADGGRWFGRFYFPRGGAVSE